MKFCYKVLALVVLASTLALVSCAGPASPSYQNATLTLIHSPICNGCAISPYPVTADGTIEMPPGGGSGSCDELSVTVTNAALNPTWTIFPTPNPAAPGQPSGTVYPPALPGPQVGTINSETGNTNFYCEPNAIPIYTGAALAQAQALGIPQGSTMVVVTNPIDPADPSKVATASVKFAYDLNFNVNNGPPTGVLIGITPTPELTLPLSSASTPSTYQFSGYVAGLPLPQGITWSVNGVIGGSAQYGTIDATGLYTAPTAYPTATVKFATVSAATVTYPTIVTNSRGEGSSTVVTFP